MRTSLSEMRTWNTILHRSRVIFFLSFGLAVLFSGSLARALPWDVPALNGPCLLRSAPKYERDRAETALIQAEQVVDQCAASQCEKIDLVYDMSCSPYLEELPPSFGQLDHLKIFNAGNAPLQQYYPLRNLQQLQMLVLSSFTGSLTEVPTLEHLEKLTFRSQGLVSLEGVQRFTSLRELYISSSGLSDIGPLEGMHWIEYLDLKRTNVSDLGPLVRTAEEFGDRYNLVSLSLKGTPLAGSNSRDIWKLRLRGISVSD